MPGHRAGHPDALCTVFGMAGTSPRLSGSSSSPFESQLGRVEDRRRFWLEKAVDAAALHEVDADQSGESERAADERLRGLCEPQQPVPGSMPPGGFSTNDREAGGRGKRNNTVRPDLATLRCGWRRATW